MIRRTTRLAAALAIAAAPLLTAAAPAHADTALPPVKHVWTIVLENSDFAVTTGDDVLRGSAYLTRTLAPRGALVPNYFGTGHSSLDNYVSMISGQGPTEATQGDCSGDAPVGGSDTSSTFGADGQALDTPDVSGKHNGCVYAADVPTLVHQLDANGLSWHGYMQDVDAEPDRLRSTCQAARWANQPNRQPDAMPKAHNDYRRKHDPFVYFHSITGLAPPATGAPSAECDANDVPFQRLFSDLAKPSAQVPSYSFITPNQCNDGHDNPTCSDGSTGGVSRIDQFLPPVVDAITNSAAFRDGGLLVVTFDEGTESTSCCNEQRSPNLAATNDNGGEGGIGPPLIARGGGQVGAVLLSPYIAPNTTSTACYNHYSYLRSMEDLFRIGRTDAIPGSDNLGHIGYAGHPGLAPVPGQQAIPCQQMSSFGSDVFTNASGATPALPEVPLAGLLPLAGLAVGSAAWVVRRRARTA